MNWYEKNINKVHWYTDILGGVFLILGIFYAFFSHVMHTKFAVLVGAPVTTAHSVHIMMGVVMLALAGGIWWYNNKLIKRNM